jgi:TRAP-type C4-dicarboxylate transport system permease small subunit
LAGGKVQALEKGVRKTNNILNAVGVGMLFVLMLQGATDVIGRYLFNKPIIGTMERGQVLLALMVFFGWGYTQIAKAHVNVDLFLRRFRPRAQAVVNFATTFMALALFIVIGWQAVVTANRYNEAGELIYVIHWPLGPFQLFVSLGALVLCLVFVLELVQFFLQIKGKS